MTKAEELCKYRANKWGNKPYTVNGVTYGTPGLWIPDLTAAEAREFLGEAEVAANYWAIAMGGDPEHKKRAEDLAVKIIKLQAKLPEEEK